MQQYPDLIIIKQNHQFLLWYFEDLVHILYICIEHLDRMRYHYMGQENTSNQHQILVCYQIHKQCVI